MISISDFFVKRLNYNIDENVCLEEVLSKPEKKWLSQNIFGKICDDLEYRKNKLNFLKKTNETPCVAKLIKFPITMNEVKKIIPDVIIENSYILRLPPNQTQHPHVDIGRKVTINIPLGKNKGNISYFLFGRKIFTHEYTGPTLTRVNLKHSGINISTTDFRYLISIDVPGSYFKNFFYRI